MFRVPDFRVTDFRSLDFRAFVALLVTFAMFALRVLNLLRPLRLHHAFLELRALFVLPVMFVMFDLTAPFVMFPHHLLSEFPLQLPMRFPHAFYFQLALVACRSALPQHAPNHSFASVRLSMIAYAKAHAKTRGCVAY